VLPFGGIDRFAGPSSMHIHSLHHLGTTTLEHLPRHDAHLVFVFHMQTNPEGSRRSLTDGLHRLGTHALAVLRRLP
jgi:hypothetical protein